MPPCHRRSVTPYYEDDGTVIYHGDCREVLPQLGRGLDLLLADPPYGQGVRVDSRRFSVPASAWWGNTDRSGVPRHRPVAADNEPFDPSHLLGYSKAILWGAQWYAPRLPARGGWLVWDKRRGIEDIDWPLSEAELAWRSWADGVRVFRHRWFGLIRDSERGLHLHPTQKPVALMEWCIGLAGRIERVIDPYMGSGPIIEAARRLGVNAVGIELDEAYCEVAARRLDQGVLPFGNTPAARE